MKALTCQQYLELYSSVPLENAAEVDLRAYANHYFAAYSGSEAMKVEGEGGEDELPFGSKNKLESRSAAPLPPPARLSATSDTLFRDWNSEFIKSMALPSFSADQAEARAAAVQRVVNDFTAASSRIGKVIIRETGLPNERKSLPPSEIGGLAGGVKYCAEGIVFKLAGNRASCQLYGDDAGASKAAGCELRAVSAMLGSAGRVLQGLHVPLLVLVDFLGFRLICCAQLPIDPVGTLVYGSSDGGHTVHKKSDEMAIRIARLGAKLNLKPHLVGPGPGTLLHVCGDLEGHIGRDGRQYVIDAARLFPPTDPMLPTLPWPLSVVSAGAGSDDGVQDQDAAWPRQSKGSVLFQHLRPEFVATWPVPLCSDAFTGFASHNAQQHCEEVRLATRAMLTTHLRSLAAQLLVLALKKEVRGGSSIGCSNLGSRFHQHGVNLRYLGLVRRAVLGTAWQDSGAGDEGRKLKPNVLQTLRRRAKATLLEELLLEAMVRERKCKLRGLLREAAALGSDTVGEEGNKGKRGWRVIVLDFVEKLHSGHSSKFYCGYTSGEEEFGECLKWELETKFPLLLTPGERSSRVTLHDRGDVWRLQARVLEAVGITGHFNFRRGKTKAGDVPEIRATVKQPSLVPRDLGACLLRQAMAGDVLGVAVGWRGNDNGADVEARAALLRRAEASLSLVLDRNPSDGQCVELWAECVAAQATPAFGSFASADASLCSAIQRLEALTPPHSMYRIRSSAMAVPTMQTGPAAVVELQGAAQSLQRARNCCLWGMLQLQRCVWLAEWASDWELAWLAPRDDEEVWKRVQDHILSEPSLARLVETARASPAAKLSPPPTARAHPSMLQALWPSPKQLAARRATMAANTARGAQSHLREALELCTLTSECLDAAKAAEGSSTDSLATETVQVSDRTAVEASRAAIVRMTSTSVLLLRARVLLGLAHCSWLVRNAGSERGGSGDSVGDTLEEALGLLPSPLPRPEDKINSESGSGKFHRDTLGTGDALRRLLAQLEKVDGSLIDSYPSRSSATPVSSSQLLLKACPCVLRATALMLKLRFKLHADRHLQAQEAGTAGWMGEAAKARGVGKRQQAIAVECCWSLLSCKCWPQKRLSARHGGRPTAMARAAWAGAAAHFRKAASSTLPTSQRKVQFTHLAAACTRRAGVGADQHVGGWEERLWGGLVAGSVGKRVGSALCLIREVSLEQPAGAIVHDGRCAGDGKGISDSTLAPGLPLFELSSVRGNLARLHVVLTVGNFLRKEQRLDTSGLTGDTRYHWTAFAQLSFFEPSLGDHFSFVRCKEGSRMLCRRYVEGVSIHLHPSFSHPVVRRRKAPYLFLGSGWGEFTLYFEVHFRFPFQHHELQANHFLRLKSGLHSTHTFVSLLPSLATSRPKHTHA